MAAVRDTTQTQAQIAEQGLGFIADTPFRPDQLDYEIVMALGRSGSTQVGISAVGDPMAASPETPVPFFVAESAIGPDVVIETFEMHVPDPAWRTPGEISGVGDGIETIILKARQEVTLTEIDIQVALRVLLIDYDQRSKGTGA